MKFFSSVQEIPTKGVNVKDNVTVPNTTTTALSISEDEANKYVLQVNAIKFVIRECSVKKHLSLQSVLKENSDKKSGMDGKSNLQQDGSSSSGSSSSGSGSSSSSSSSVLGHGASGVSGNMSAGAMGPAPVNKARLRRAKAREEKTQIVEPLNEEETHIVLDLILDADSYLTSLYSNFKNGMSETIYFINLRFVV